MVVLFVELMSKGSAFSLLDMLQVDPVIEIEMSLALLADSVQLLQMVLVSPEW